jgi:DNA primase
MTILTLLQQILGTYAQQTDEYLFFCPFCHHSKKKLSINISNNKWKCWTCGSKGGHIIWLLKKLNISKELINQFKEVLGDEDIKIYKSTTADIKLYLPHEYQPLWKPQKSYAYLNAISYVKQRGIRPDDILRYRMGYCETGPYAGRIIVPSYDCTNQLNYFTARSFYEGGMKYKNPPVTKNIVCFENMVNWNDQIILCEGMFDAISLRRNAIPLLGKTIPRNLEKALLQNKVKNVVIFLDEDAQSDAMKLEQHLKQYDMNVSVVLTKGKDAADMGFETAWEEISNSRSTNFKEYIEQRLLNI